MVEICQRLQSEQLRLSTAALTRDIVERPFRSSKLINGGGIFRFEQPLRA
jgi:hypothetical protein